MDDLTIDSTGLSEPSAEFEDAFCDSGSIHAQCDGCGRVFFNYMDAPDFEKGELDALQRKAKENPTGWIGVDHTIGFVYLMGYKYVVGCPCNKIRIFEDFLLENQQQIKKYFLSKAERLRESVEVAESIGNS